MEYLLENPPARYNMNERVEELRCAMGIEYTVIGRHIRAARKQKKLTQEDVAEAISMSTAHFGKVERGNRPINLHRLSQLSLLFDVPLETLVEGAVIADDGATISERMLADDSDFLDKLASIAKGCSDEALRLMLRLCAAVADEDKVKPSKS